MTISLSGDIVLCLDLALALRIQSSCCLSHSVLGRFPLRVVSLRPECSFKKQRIVAQVVIEIPELYHMPIYIYICELNCLSLLFQSHLLPGCMLSLPQQSIIRLIHRALLFPQSSPKIHIK